MNIFNECLADSHAAEDLPFWNEVYEKAFPEMIVSLSHRQDGQHQRQGIDRSIILNNSKQVLIDEKVRFRNKITGKIYNDIALEYMSDEKRGIPGWVCKPLLCDFIAYAIAPLGKCYLLPVQQLQQAWAVNNKEWLKEYRTIRAENRGEGGHRWTTLSLPIPVGVLFKAIGQCLRVNFQSYEE